MSIISYGNPWENIFNNKHKYIWGISKHIVYCISSSRLPAMNEAHVSCYDPSIQNTVT